MGEGQNFSYLSGRKILRVTAWKFLESEQKLSEKNKVDIKDNFLVYNIWPKIEQRLICKEKGWIEIQLSKFKSTQYKDEQPTNLLCVNALIVPAKKNK